MYSKFPAALLLVAAIGISSFSGLNKRNIWKRSMLTGPVGTVSLIVDKSDYELHVYDDKGWYATYPVVFGTTANTDKMMEGDRRTPEGRFRILNKRPHNKWNKFALIDYPNKVSWDKFKRRKAQGIIPSTAKIGGAIGIHGTWPNDAIVVDDFRNWTQGCISLRNYDMDELYRYIQSGTAVTIRR